MSDTNTTSTTTSARHLSVAEVARRLSVSERTVRREIVRGNLPAKRVGRVLRIDPEDLAVFDYQAPAPRRATRNAPMTRRAWVSTTPREQAAARRRQVIRESDGRTATRTI